MSSDFYPIAEYVIGHHEGGYNKIKQDNGGATNYGISLRFLQVLDLADADVNGDGHVTEADIQALSMKASLELYKKHFWDHYAIDQFAVPVIKQKMFSLLINMRGRVAMKCMQRALRAVGANILDDGLFGARSRAAFAERLDKHGASPILSALKSEAAGTYRLIAKANPSQAIFLNGWLNRAYD